MKIAFIANYMLESVAPLAKNMVAKNHEVHVYATMPKRSQNMFVVDFSDSPQPNGFISDGIKQQQMGATLLKYLAGVKFDFFIFPAGSGKRTFFTDIYYAWQLSQQLKQEKFDIINVIHTCNRFTLLLMFFLKKECLVQTLHEVTAHSGDTSTYEIRIMNQLIKKNIPIIFHSHISLERFIKYRKSVDPLPIPDGLYQMIRFGLYETYTHHLPVVKNEMKKATHNGVPVILHFGKIVPYKGIDILIEAIKIIQQNTPVHLIVAGAGKPYFTFDGVNSYEFINSSLSTEKIVSLIEQSVMVVCPYKSGSQSGIPPSVFPFNKPIVASNTGGFKEVIDDNVTGLIIDNNTPETLAKTILRLLNDKELQKNMAANIQQKFKLGEFSWQEITKQTISFYEKHLPRL